MQPSQWARKCPDPARQDDNWTSLHFLIIFFLAQPDTLLRSLLELAIASLCRSSSYLGPLCKRETQRVLKKNKKNKPEYDL